MIECLMRLMMMLAVLLLVVVVAIVVVVVVVVVTVGVFAVATPVSNSCGTIETSESRLIWDGR